MADTCNHKCAFYSAIFKMEIANTNKCILLRFKCAALALCHCLVQPTESQRRGHGQ